MTTPKTQAQIDRLIEDGKIAIVGYSLDGQPPAVLVERYDREGRAKRETIEIKPSRLSRAGQHRADNAQTPEPEEQSLDAGVDQGYREIAAEHTAIEKAEKALQAALAQRPIHSAERKANNRLEHARLRFEEAKAALLQAETDADQIRQLAEHEWLTKAQTPAKPE